MTPGSMEYVIMRNIKVRTHAMAVANWYHQGRVRILWDSTIVSLIFPRISVYAYRA